MRLLSLETVAVQGYTSSHPVLPKERFVEDFEKSGTTFFRTYALPIEIQDGAWTGGGSIILP